MNKKTIINNTIIGNNNNMSVAVNLNGVYTSDGLLITNEYVYENTKRTERIVNTFKKFVSDHKNALSKPIIRCYGLFSDLAMIDNMMSDRSDRSFLLSEEKNAFLSSIDNEFPIQQIISLDTSFIIHARGYSLEQYQYRTEQLIDQLSLLKKNNNLNVVFDYIHRKCNRFILGDKWLIDTIEMNKKDGYTKTQFTNDPLTIQHKIKEFDSLFSELERETAVIKKHLGTPDIDAICKILAEKRELAFLEKNNRADR